MIPEILLSKLKDKTTIDSATGCWLYSSVNQRGHGQIRWNGKTQGVHRLSAHFNLGLDLDDKFQQANHKITCPNRNCWNPDHLYVGNQSQNIMDTVIIGTYNNQNTVKTHCIRGHLLEGDNVNIDKNGGRRCKICKKEYDAEHYISYKVT